MLLLVFTWRVDQAVRTAYSSGWKIPAVSPDGTAPGCVGCRLPSETWSLAHTLLGVLAIVLLVGGLALWRLRSKPADDAVQLDVLVAVLSAIAVVTALCTLYLRRSADVGKGAGWLTAALIGDLSTLGVLALIALAITLMCAAPDEPLVERARRFFQRQRVNLVGVAGFALILTLVPQTSGQAIDSIRTWVVDSPHGHARLAFGLATSLLLALTVYESSLRLDQAAAAAARPGEEDHVTALQWLGAGLVAIAAGLVLHFALPAGWGLVAIGGVLVALAGLERARLPNPRAGTVAAARGPRVATAAPDRIPEYLAIAPLLAIAAITIAAAVDAALSGGEDPGPFWVLAPGLGLAAVAVLFTSTRHEPDLTDPPLHRWLFAAMAVAAITATLAFLLRSDTWSAVFGFTLFALGVAYAAALFHAPKRLVERHSGWLLTLPVALVSGVVVAILLHARLHGVADTLGVFGLVNLALACGLAAFHYAVDATLHRRAPGLLWWFGIEQLPLLSVIAVCWVAAGLVFPDSAHDVRLVARPAVGGAVAEGPTLRTAFREWVDAQPELRAGSAGPPVPLLVVAAHGGGIRAAYWTALALDCVVRGSVRGFDPAAARRGAAATCAGAARPRLLQQSAARRIFLASGVSGGAVGLYAYARRLLQRESLGADSGWVRSYLGGDFASDTIGWGLFHDVPNHIVGLRPRAGGACRLRLAGQCETQDRAAALADSFDRPWDSPSPGLVETWALRHAADPALKMRARLVPLLVMNATVAGGDTRAVVTAANLSAWPQLETAAPAGADGVDAEPLAGTVDVSEVLCGNADIPLSGAALLAARFPYVAPSGRLEGGCPRPPGRDVGEPRGDCLQLGARCAVAVVDGGYVDNSGLLTAIALWPSLRQLTVEHNAAAGARKIALVLLELDNHYRPAPATAPRGSPRLGETLIPPATALGGRTAMETYARAEAYRLTPPGCTVTVSPPLHPGLTAPLGWELSRGAQTELRDALVREPPNARTVAEAVAPVLRLRRLQAWLGRKQGIGLGPTLAACVPGG